MPDTVRPEGPCPWPLSCAASQPVGCSFTPLLHPCRAPAMSQSPDRICRCRARSTSPALEDSEAAAGRPDPWGPCSRRAWWWPGGVEKASAGVQSPELWQSPLRRPGHQGHQPWLAELPTSPESHALANRIRLLPQELQPGFPKPHPCSSTCCPQPLAEIGASLYMQESLGDGTGYVPTT